VKTEQEKDLAETVAFTVAAVRGVHNQLTVAKQPAEKEQPERRASSTRQRRKSQTED
jgi:osmotically-inducible protein OsmY